MQTSARDLIEQGPSLSVSILAANLLRLGEDLEALRTTGINLAHVDVMDGVFCPQMTVGRPIVEILPQTFVKDVHLMIQEPLEKVHTYLEAGAGIITFHVEATRHPHRVLQSLAGSGVVRGVALNPGTPVSAIKPLLDDLELVLVLAVNPGWDGQSFISSTQARIAEARALVSSREIVVAVDGGVTRANVEYVASLGVDLIVTGRAVYGGEDPIANARAMLTSVSKGRKRASSVASSESNPGTAE